MFDQKTQDQICLFRRWRKSLSTTDLHTLCQQVVDFWCTAPLSNQYYSADYDQNWPSPWEMIAEGIYDDVVLGLAMFYSLVMLEQCEHEITLIVVEQPNEIRLCVLVDDLYILNLDWGQVIDKSQLSTQIKIIRTYNKLDFESLK